MYMYVTASSLEDWNRLPGCPHITWMKTATGTRHSQWCEPEVMPINMLCLCISLCTHM